MSIINKEIEITIHNKNIKYYEDKGYQIPKYKYQGVLRVKRGTKIIIKTKDLLSGSHVSIKMQCDRCGEINNVVWKNYLQQNHKNNEYYCKKCSNKLISKTNKRIKNKLIKGKSFYDWCYENLSKGQANETISRWDTELNKCSAKEVCYSSHKKYWFKCPRGIHESEQHSIHITTVQRRLSELHCRKCNSIAQYLIDNYGQNALNKYWSNKNTLNPWSVTKKCNKKIWIKCQKDKRHPDYLITAHNFVEDNHRCLYCSNQKVYLFNSLGYVYPESLKYWSNKNKKTPFEYTKGSTKKVWWKCPNGKHKDFKRIIANSVIYNFRCPECDYSKGEERISNYLINNKIDYIPQKEFEGLLGLGNGNLSYDFYLEQYNLLIEFQGRQHAEYIPGLHKSKKDFEKQLEHDYRKRNYAKKHNIKELEIWYNCFDDIEYILDMVLNKRINNKIKFNEGID